MKILIAPNAFKGTIEADEAAKIIQQSILSTNKNVQTQILPIADGGDGTCFLLAKILKLEQVNCWALDALGRPVSGYFFLDSKNKTAYLDVSTVSGIKHLKSFEKSPWTCSTYGTGELIREAQKHEIQHVVLGLGGSATIDLGIGILAALGFSFLDQRGRALPMFSEKFISKIRHIQRPLAKPHLTFTCLCDVNNKFFGDQGAVPVFGPQKGLDDNEIPEYEKMIRRVLDMLGEKSGKLIQDREGFGAAGGIAYGLSYFFPVVMKMGAQWFFEQVKIEEKIKWADLVITGEGRYDAQSTAGKGSFELLQLLKMYQKKSLLITSGNCIENSGFESVIQLPFLDFNQEGFINQAKENLKKAVTAQAHFFEID